MKILSNEEVRKRSTELMPKIEIKADEYYELLKYNHFSITDLDLLEKKEEKVSKLKVIEIYCNLNSELISESNISRLSSLQKIHKLILGDIYVWAGEIRNIDIAKNNFTFFRHKMMKAGIEYFDCLSDRNLKEIIIKHTEFNYIHPFYEGNGRVGRIWLDLILYTKIKKVINWANIDKREYMDYMIEVGNNPNDFKNLLNLFERNLIEYKDVDLNFIFRTVDNSYNYEGLKKYSSKDLYLKEKEGKI